MKVRLDEYKKLGTIGNVIYKITCALSDSGKGMIGYIGKTSGSVRFRTYCILQCGNQPKLYNSLKKYGIENHYVEILYEIPNFEGLNGLQKLCIEMHGTFVNGLNCTLGGDGTVMFPASIGTRCSELNVSGLTYSQVSKIIAKQNNLSGVSIDTVKALIIRSGNIPINNFEHSNQICLQCWNLNKQGKNYSQIRKIMALKGVLLKQTTIIRLISFSGNQPINHRKARSLSILNDVKSHIESGLSLKLAAKKVGMKKDKLQRMIKNNNFVV